jgi:hypothetical protein
MCITVIHNALRACDRLNWPGTKATLRREVATGSMKSAEAFARVILEAAAEAAARQNAHQAAA